MARDPRLLYGESGLVEITSRTTQGRLLLLASKEANARILGVLGRAQAKYGVYLHAFIVLSNHLHFLMSVLSGKQMADFWRYFKSNTAKELGNLYEWEGALWGRRYHHAEVGDAEDQAGRLEYLFRNGCKEGLVGSPLNWPGVSSAAALCAGRAELEGGIWNDRTAQYRARGNGPQKLFQTKEIVRLTPMPFLADRSAEEQRQYYQDLFHRIEQETAQMHQKSGTSPLGERAILRVNPHSKPRELDSSPAPRFHVANREERRALEDARIATIVAYREASARLRRGETDVTFPQGSFPPPLPFVESKAPT